MARQHLTRRPAQLKHKFRGDWRIAYAATDTIGAKIFAITHNVFFLSGQCGFHHAQRFYRFFDIMDANNLRALHCCNDRTRQAAVQAFVGPTFSN
jgi:hypothetical protein